MTTCGIIAEFNPFHNGHAYLIEQARRLTKADTIIVFMSGNFLQRGEPSMVNKWTRTKWALENGVDLVIEIPTEFVISSANDFAKAGIMMANLMQIDYLAFGSEHPQLDFVELGRYLKESRDLPVRSNESYATQLFRNIEDQTGQNISDANDILGINYAHWWEELHSQFKLVPIQRIGNDFHSTEVKGSVASATAIRKSVLENQLNSHDIRQVVPSDVFRTLNNSQTSFEQYWPLIRYRVLVSSESELASFFNIDEGIEFRIKKVIKSSHGLTNFIEQLKSKRYTYTKLQRICTSILLNFTKSEHDNMKLKPRLLGSSVLGRKYLKETGLSEKLAVRLSNDDYRSNYLVTQRADDVYQLKNSDSVPNKPIFI